jgi:hypothetical protein
MLMLSGHGVIAQQNDKIVLLNIGNIGTDRSAVRATRDFWKRVGESKDERWYKLSHGYMAQYTEGAIQARYVYDHKGMLRYSLLTYSEKELPADVRKLVRSSYYDFTISWVKELNEDQTRVYIVHLDDSVSFKEIAVQDGEFREIASFAKPGH